MAKKGKKWVSSTSLSTLIFLSPHTILCTTLFTKFTDSFATLNLLVRFAASCYLSIKEPIRSHRCLLACNFEFKSTPISRCLHVRASAVAIDSLPGCLDSASDGIPEFWAAIDDQLALISKLVAMLEQECKRNRNDCDHAIGPARNVRHTEFHTCRCRNLHNHTDEAWNILGRILRSEDETAGDAANTTKSDKGC